MQVLDRERTQGVRGRDRHVAGAVADQHHRRHRHRRAVAVAHRAAHGDAARQRHGAFDARTRGRLRDHRGAHAIDVDRPLARRQVHEPDRAVGVGRSPGEVPAQVLQLVEPVHGDGDAAAGRAVADDAHDEFARRGRRGRVRRCGRLDHRRTTRRRFGHRRDAERCRGTGRRPFRGERRGVDGRRLRGIQRPTQRDENDRREGGHDLVVQHDQTSESDSGKEPSRRSPAGREHLGAHRRDPAATRHGDGGTARQTHGQRPPQQVDAARDLRAHGAGRPFEGARDLLRLQAVFTHEPQHRPVDLGQPIDRLPQLGGHLERGDVVVGIDDGRLQPRRVDEAPRSAPRRARVVDEDADEPRQDTFTVAVRSRVLDRRDEGRLHEVLGIGAGTREVTAELQQFRRGAIEHDRQRPRVAVPLEALERQLDGAGEHSPAPGPQRAFVLHRTGRNRRQRPRHSRHPGIAAAAQGRPRPPRLAPPAEGLPGLPPGNG